MTPKARKQFSKLVKLARKDFLAYLLLFNNPQTSDIILGDFHKFLAEVVQGVVEGYRDPFQSVSVAPQHGKSTILCIEAASWIMGHSPGISIAITGHRHDLMCEFSKAVRARVEHPFYDLVFPDAGGIARGYNKVDSWKLTSGSSLRAKTVGSKLVGNRVDWLIIDDAHAGREEAESETQRSRVHRWYFGDCVSRLSPGAKVFIIGTRWHPKDLIGHLTRPEYVSEVRAAGQHDRIFQVTNLPALAGPNDPLGREEGEALFPEVRNKAWLAGVKASIPNYEWASQFQGDPKSIHEGQVDITKLRRCIKERVPIDIARLRGWDLALTEKQTSDYSVGALCAYDKAADEFYVIDIYRKRLSWSKLKPQVISIAKKDKREWNVNRMGLEAVAGFKIGLSQLRSSLSGEVKIEERNPPKGGKLMRAQDWLNALEAGKLIMVEGAWNKSFVDELTDFPESEHDDQIDAVSVAWESLVRKKKLLYA